MTHPETEAASRARAIPLPGSGLLLAALLLCLAASAGADPGSAEAPTVLGFLSLGPEGLAPLLAPDGEPPPVTLDTEPLGDPNSEFLDRGRRNPWMAALASLVLPGAGQFYNAFTPYGFTLRGFDAWMYAQGGVHAFFAVVTLVQQFSGLKIETPSTGGSWVLTERNAQSWRIAHGINALVAAVSAFFEARLINEHGRRYVMGMRMRAGVEPDDGTAWVEVGFRF